MSFCLQTAVTDTEVYVRWFPALVLIRFYSFFFMSLHPFVTINTDVTVIINSLQFTTGIER